MAEKTKTLKVKQIAAAHDKDKQNFELFAVVEDGSVWRYMGDEWEELPAIEVVEEADESEDD